jgi:glycerol-3-phosphate dehydrogenase (NAD(P)+)
MTQRSDTIGIAGAGRFGTALGAVLARAGRRVVLWSHEADIVAAIRTTRRNPRLPTAVLPESLEATCDPRTLASAARFVVLAVTSTSVRERARELGGVLDGSHIVVHAIGALAQPFNERVSQAMEQGLPTLKIGAIAGPALPDDLVDSQYASLVVASAFDEVTAEGRRLLNTPPVLRVYGSRDLIGVELASALSGAYTVVLGLGDGLGVGPGPRAVLITRVVAEASRLVTAAGAEAKTFAGLAGLGNLLVRTSDRSADYQFGRRLAGGTGLADAGQTEGGRAAVAGVELAGRLGVHVPVLSAIATVLAGRVHPSAIATLISDTVAEAE